MKLKKQLINLIIIIIIAAIYILPVSTGVYRNADSVTMAYDVFSKVRIVFIILAIALFLVNSRQRKSTYMILLAIIFIFVFKFLFYNELDFGIAYIMASLIIFDNILYNETNHELIKKMFVIAFYMYIVQIIVFSIGYYGRYGVFRITSSFNDSNYTAYFGLCLAYYFYSMDQKIKASILAIILLFTFSRLYIVNILICFLLSRIFKKKINIKIQYTVLFYLTIQLLVIGVGIYYNKLYEVIQPEYVYLQGFQRLKGMLDQSNYIRFKANMLALNSLSIKSFFLGLQSDSFEGLHIFTNKSIFPHNLMWSIYIQYGLMISLILISKYIKIFKKFNDGQMIYFIALLLYHSFLGLSSFYGFDLILQLFIISNISINKRRKFDV